MHRFLVDHSISFDKDLNLCNSNSNQDTKHYYHPESSLMSLPCQPHRRLLFWLLSIYYTLENGFCFMEQQLISLMITTDNLLVCFQDFAIPTLVYTFLFICINQKNC